MFLAKVNRVSRFLTPGVFDYRLYLASQSIYMTGTIQHPAQILFYLDRTMPWYKKILYTPERVRGRIGMFLDNHLPAEQAGMYKALLLGSRSGIDKAVLEQYKVTGCMHLLAISGIHMGLLGLMVFLVLSFLMKQSRYLLEHTHVPTLATLFTLVPLVAYGFIAGLNTPVLRALIMATFFLVAVVLRRQKSILHVIAAAALIMLIFKPLALFTVSFQLSFSAILAIAVIYPHLLSNIEKETGSPGRKFLTYIYTALMVSIAATLGSLPFMLLHFNRFSTIGPVMNLLVEPLLCLWALPIGLCALPILFIAPHAAAFILKIGALGIEGADWLILKGSSIPWASVWTVTPSPVEIILYAVLVLFWTFSAKNLFRKITLTTVSILFLLYFMRGLWFTMPGAVSEITYLDIGQGSSSLIRQPGGKTVLVETNGTKNIDHFQAPIIRVMDIKCPGSGEFNKMDWENIDRLRASDNVKFVISHREDFDWAVNVVKKYNLLNRAIILFSPAYKLLKPEDLAWWLLEVSLPIRLNLQLHKYINVK